MVNFFERLFKRSDNDVPVPSGSEQRSRREDPELLALRERNFERNLDEYLRRTVSEDERSMARAALTDPRSGNLEAISAQEMRARFMALNLHPDAEPENMIDGKVFEPRGNRQMNFERGLAKALGREITEEDLAEAQEFIESDPERKAAFDRMTGEQVAHYAETVVRRLLVNRLRAEESGAERNVDDIAAK